MTNLECSKCGGKFEKHTGEYNRRLKAGQTKFYCSQTCQVTVRNVGKPNVQNLRKGRVRDELSPFRWFLARVRYRVGAQETDLTAEWLKELWEKQSGVCVLTGWNLKLPVDTGIAFTRHVPDNASLDRIDNSRGYTKDNVRYVAYIANVARNDFTDEQLLEFCHAVASRGNNA